MLKFKWVHTLFLITLSLNAQAAVIKSNDTFLARVATHSNNATGNGDIYTLKYDQTIYNDGITYDNATGHFILPASGTYVVTWSFPIGNLTQYNNTGKAWLHAAGNELTIYDGNPWAESTRGGVPGGGTDMIAIVGSYTFTADVSIDPNVWISLKVDGDPSKNVALVYDAFFSLQKIDA